MPIRRLLSAYPTFFVFVAALFFYGLSAGTQIDDQSRTPQYVYLANSFLHGRTDLIELPERKFDLINYQDRWYVPGGMGPALLLIPVVAIFGLKTSDILFGVVIGALNVALMFSLLDTINPEKPVVRNWLTLLFAAGTVHWWVSSVGSVWLNALLVGVLFMLLFTRETVGKNRPWLAGIWLGLAALSRPPTLFAFPFYVVFTIRQEASWRDALRKLLPFGLTFLISILIMMVYNFVRFGSPLEFGYLYVGGTEALTRVFAQTGGFSPRYIPCNMYVSLLGLPNLAWSPLPSVNDVCSHLQVALTDFGPASSFFNPLGMSIFVTTPAFFLLFKNRLKNKLDLPAWIGTICVLIPLWMYHTTGWVQFGYRYVLDFIVFLFILLSTSIERIGKPEIVLIAASVVMGFFGLYTIYYAALELLWDEMFVQGIRIVLSMLP